MQIHLSPSASALAIHLHQEVGTHQQQLQEYLAEVLDGTYAGEAGTNILTVSDADVAATLELAPDTVYRALGELQERGALTFESGSKSRRLSLNLTHWIWTATAQLTAPEDAVL